MSIIVSFIAGGTAGFLYVFSANFNIYIQTGEAQKINLCCILIYAIIGWS